MTSKYEDPYKNAMETLEKSRTEFLALRDSVLQEILCLQPNSIRGESLETFRLAVWRQAEKIKEALDMAVEIPQDAKVVTVKPIGRSQNGL